MKKFLYMVGLAALILINTTVVNATGEVYYTNRYNIEMTEQEYHNLLELGFTEAQIYRMDYQTFIDNKDIEAELLATETKYIKTTTTIRNGIAHSTNYEMTHEQIMNDMLMHNHQSFLPGGDRPNISGSYYDGFSFDSYRMMECKIANLYDIELRYKVDVQWLQMPPVRSFDIIGIGIEPSKVKINSVIMFRQDWILTNNNDGYGTLCAPKSESTGGSAVFELPTGSLSVLESYLYFTVNKQNNAGTIYSTIAVGDYAHAFEEVDNGVYNYYTVNAVMGIEIDEPYANSYESSSEAIATFVGVW